MGTKTLEQAAFLGYANGMATAHTPPTEMFVHDPKTGRLLPLRGYGAMKGHLTINKGIDLTKPIAAQVLKASKGKSAPTKR